MSDMSIADRVEAEAEEFERNGGEPVREVAPVRRGGERATVMSVRLTREQYRDLEARAKAEGTKTSTLARDLLLAGLYAAEEEQVVESAVERALQRRLRPELDAAVNRSFGPAFVMLVQRLDPALKEQLRESARDLDATEFAHAFATWTSLAHPDVPVSNQTD
jgi:hypothetical protein